MSRLDARLGSHFVAALVVALMLPAVATAQVDEAADARARTHFAAASAYFDEGDYENAVTGFRAAYAASPRPGLLYNIYLCEERLGHLDEAIEALEQYLASDAPIENRSSLEARLGHLRERQAAGESTTDAAEVTTPTPVPTSSSGPSALAIAGFTVAGVGLLSLAVFGPWTIAEDGRLGSTCSPGCTGAETELLGALGIAADVSAAVALVGAVLGVVGLFLPGDVERAAPSARLRIGPTSLSLEGAF